MSVPAPRLKYSAASSPPKGSWRAVAPGTSMTTGISVLLMRIVGVLSLVDRGKLAAAWKA